MQAKIEFLEKLFGKGQYHSSNKEIVFYCPWCFHYKRKLSFNLETDRYKCWVCNQAGKNFIYPIKKVGTKADVQKYIQYFKSSNVCLQFNQELKEEIFKVSLPEEFVPLVNCKDTIYGQRAYKYLFSRGITEDDILFYKIGIAFDGEYRDRIIIPSFDNEGSLNFFIARAIINSYMKYMQPVVPRGYKIDCIFNDLNIDWSRPVVLVEGFFDAIKAFNAIPLFGSSLTQEYSVFQKIVKSGNSVYLALDADATKKAQYIGNLFLKYDIDVKFIDVNPFRDCGEMNKEQFLEKMNCAVSMSKENIFKSKLQRLFV